MTVKIELLPTLRGAVIAHGLRAVIEGMDLDLTVEFSAVNPGMPVKEVPAELPAAPAPVSAKAKTKTKTKRVCKLIDKPTPKAAKPRTAPTGGDPRGSVRDAIRRSLSTAGKDIIAMVQDVQRTFPEKGRDYVGTVLCQLARYGECELGDDGKWRKAA